MKPFLIAFILLALSCKDHKESITTETPVDSLGFSFSKQKTKDDILNIAKSQTVRIVISFINNEKKCYMNLEWGWS